MALHVPTVRLSALAQVLLCVRGSRLTAALPAAVVPVDLNFDGQPEWLVPGGDGRLYCLEPGTPITEYWPSVDVAHGQPLVQVGEPVVADLDGDGAPEVPTHRPKCSDPRASL